MSIENFVLREYNTVAPNVDIRTIQKDLFKQKFLVVRDNEKFLGIIISNRNLVTTPQPVIDCITPLPHINCDDSINDILELMRQRNLSVLPVFENGHFIGVVTWTSLIKKYFIVQNALQESEVLFHTITTRALDAIFMVNSKGNITFWNKAAISIFGYSMSDVIGRGIDHILSSDGVYKDYYINILKSQKIGSDPPVGKTFEINTRKKDGSEILIELSLSIVRIQGEWYSTGIARDITERKRFESKLLESERRYSALFQNANDGIVVANMESMKPVFTNPSLLDMFGYSADEMHVLTIVDLHPKKYLDNILTYLEEVKSSEKTSATEISCLRKDGRIFYADVNYAIISFDEHLCFVGFFRDVTERIQIRAIEKRKNRLTQAINNIYNAVISTKTEDELVTAFLTEAEKLTDSSFGFVDEKDVNNTTRKLIVSKTGMDTYRIPISNPESIIQRLDRHGILSGLLGQEESRIVNNTHCLSHSEEVMRDDCAIVSAMVVPLRHEKETIGTVVLANKESGYDLNDQNDMEELSDSFVRARMRKRYQIEIKNAHEKIKKQAEDLYRNKRVFESIVDRSADAITVVDAEGKVLFANPSAHKMFNKRNTDFVGGKFGVAVYEGTTDIDILRLSGQEGIAEMSTQKTQWHNHDAHLIVLRDITERKQAEYALISLNNNLKEVVNKLQELDRTRSEFIANMSHELKTPLNAVTGYVSIMIDGIGGAVSEKQRSWLTSIDRQSRHLLSLIEEILDFSKLDVGKIKIEYQLINLKALISDIVSATTALINRKPIQLNTVVELSSIELCNDSNRLRQVLLNLLSNAVKFTKQGAITLIVRQKDNDSVEFIVKDEGVGISEDKQKYIFEPFVQVDTSTTREVGGTGLGLTIVNRLVNLMGGTISVESELGKGSTFCVAIPRQPRSKVVLVPAV